LLEKISIILKTNSEEINRLVRDLIGMPKEDAMAKIKAAGFPFRIRSEDGNYFVGTADLKLERFNLVVEKGLVTEVKMG
jgi:hypothetical protein